MDIPQKIKSSQNYLSVVSLHYIQMELQIKPTSKQHLAWLAWDNDGVDDVVFGGAAGGGKTYFGCEAITISALRYPNTRYFIGRKELKTLMQTCFVTLTQKVFVDFKLQRDYHWKFDGKYNVVYLRASDKHAWSTINLLDLAYNPSDPLYDRFGSHEYTRGWIEEASEADFKAYDVLKSRIGRYNNVEQGIKSKLLLTLNPSQDWPYRIFYDPWKKAGKPTDPNSPLVSARSMLEGKEVTRTFVLVPALYKDNPYTAGEYAKNLAGISDPVLKQRLMDGDWDYASAADTLFDAQSIADMFTSRLIPTEQRFMTVDVARFGGDNIVRTIWYGWDAKVIKYKTHAPLTETADDIRSDMQMYGIPRQNVLVDADGIGGGVLDLLPGIIGFSGGAAPFGTVGEKDVRENYENLRSQCIYHLSEKARDRGIAISEENLQVREYIAQDLQQFKRRDVDKDGKLKVARKEDMKQNLGRSPDFGDTLMMRSYFDVRQKEAELAGDGIAHVIYHF